MKPCGNQNYDSTVKTSCPKKAIEPCVAFSPNCRWDNTGYASTHKLQDDSSDCAVCKKIFIQDGADISFFVAGETWDEHVDDSVADSEGRQSPYFSRPIIIPDVLGTADEDSEERGNVVALVAKTGTLNFISGGQPLNWKDAKPFKIKSRSKSVPWKNGLDFVTIKISTPGHINLAIWNVTDNSLWFFDPHSGTTTHRRTRSHEFGTQCDTKSEDADRISNGMCLFFEALGRLNPKASFNMKSFHTIDIQESKEDELCQTWTLYWIYKIFVEGVDKKTATEEVAKAAVSQIERTCADPNENLLTCGYQTAPSLRMIHAFGRWLNGSEPKNWPTPPLRVLPPRRGRAEGTAQGENSDDDEKESSRGPRGVSVDPTIIRWNERICQMSINLRQLLNCKMEGHSIALFNASKYLSA